MKIHQAIIITFAALLIFACGSTAVKTDTPTDTLKTFVEASKKKDASAMRRVLSKGSIELFEAAAKRYDLSVDDVLKKSESGLFSENLVTRNEHIEGDTATVEVENNIGGYDAIPLVREDGAWKIAFDKNPQQPETKK